MHINTNWYVITGGPNCGKTPIIEALALQGYSIRPETATVHINQGFSEGKTIEEMRADEESFQDKILELKLFAERNSYPNETIFWDRGNPDSITYARLKGITTTKAEEASRSTRYKGIFVLELLPKYFKDNRRTEDETERRRIHDALIEDYKRLDYNPIIIPVVPIDKRVELILKNL